VADLPDGSRASREEPLVAWGDPYMRETVIIAAACFLIGIMAAGPRKSTAMTVRRFPPSWSVKKVVEVVLGQEAAFHMRTPLTVVLIATVVAVIAAFTLFTAQRTSSESVGANREFHLLWPNGAPGALGGDPIDRPKITVYRPVAAKANGAAVIICPGGGYSYLAADHEGSQVAEWLNSFGVSAFVLEYRIGPRYRHPAPLLDAQRAVRMVRVHAGEWSIDPLESGSLASLPEVISHRP
jgi:acetyl esterase/lipase